MKRLVSTAAIVILLTAGCGDDRNQDTGIPNPAAVYCEDQGGTTTGPEPMCELPDGSIVDAWGYYREHHPQDTEP
ncbi:MAG: DUF333 domain-containing protein [Acidimicrobiales bacterium]